MRRVSCTVNTFCYSPNNNISDVNTKPGVYVDTAGYYVRIEASPEQKSGDRPASDRKILVGWREVKPPKRINPIGWRDVKSPDRKGSGRAAWVSQIPPVTPGKGIKSCPCCRIAKHNAVRLFHKHDLRMHPSHPPAPLAENKPPARTTHAQFMVVTSACERWRQ